MPSIAAAISCELGPILTPYLNCLAPPGRLDSICVVTKGILSIVLKALWVTVVLENNRRETMFTCEIFLAAKNGRMVNETVSLSSLRKSYVKHILRHIFILINCKFVLESCNVLLIDIAVYFSSLLLFYCVIHSDKFSFKGTMR